MKKYAAIFCACAMLAVNASVAHGKPAKADNTAQNRGALEENAVTAEKQGNGKEQIKILANIRKKLVEDKELSMDAKNIKILVSDSNFAVLRGPVNSAAEKEKVEEMVKKVAGVTGIKTELSVAAKPQK